MLDIAKTFYINIYNWLKIKVYKIFIALNTWTRLPLQ